MASELVIVTYGMSEDLRLIASDIGDCVYVVWMSKMLFLTYRPASLENPLCLEFLSFHRDDIPPHRPSKMYYFLLYLLSPKSFFFLNIFPLDRL